MSCSLFIYPIAQTMTPETFQCAMTTNSSAPTFAASKCSVSRHLLSAVAVCGVSLIWALPTQAASKYWANPVTGGSWSDASKWTGGVPTGTDSATFNKAGTYTVSFSNVFQNLTDMFLGRDRHL